MNTGYFDQPDWTTVSEANPGEEALLSMCKGKETKLSTAISPASTGTGFVVNERGHVLTNRHVVQNCSRVAVVGQDRRRIPAQNVAVSKDIDLALLLPTQAMGKPASFRLTPARLGEQVVAFGFPLRGLLASAGNVTAGNVTALAGLGNDPSVYQISAPIQPGNSGGPVLDMAANVLGVTVSKLDALQVAQVTSDIPQNINFAIRASEAIGFLRKNGIGYVAGNNAERRDVERVAAQAQSSSLVVECYQ